MPKLRFFDTEQEVVDYLTRELLDTLRDDLAHCTGRDEAETRRDLKAKIRDIESIEDRLSVLPVPTTKNEEDRCEKCGYIITEHDGCICIDESSKPSATDPTYKDLVAALGTAVAEWSYLFPEKFDDNQHESRSRKSLRQAERTYKKALQAIEKGA